MHTGNIQTIAISPESPETLYIGTNDAGGFMSTNGGQTWNSFSMDTSIPKSQYIYTLVFSPDFASSGIMYAGTQADVYKSSDRGNTWVQKLTGSEQHSVLSIAIDPLTPEIMYSGTGVDAWESMDAGETWKEISDEFANIRSFVITSVSTDTIYAGTTGDGVFKTTDGGISWTKVNEGLTNMFVWTLLVDPYDSETLYAGTNGNGIFKTTDGGENWTAASTGIGNIIVYTIAVHPRNPAVIYAGTNSGIFCTEDGGASWNKISSNTDFTVVRSLAIDDSAGTRIYAGTSTKGLFGCTVAVPGDINGDTVVGLDDAILGLKILAGINTDDVVVDMNADVNGDTRIGIEEVIFILKEMAASQNI